MSMNINKDAIYLNEANYLKGNEIFCGVSPVEKVVKNNI